MELTDDMGSETPSDVEARRRRVWARRLRGMTADAIATDLGISPATVREDIASTRQSRLDTYGATSGVNRAEFIGETSAVYQHLEQLALLEHARLREVTVNDPRTAVMVARQRMACLRVAADMREKQAHLLDDLGLLAPPVEQGKPTIPRAAFIRDALKANPVHVAPIDIDDPSLMSVAERRWRGITTDEPTSAKEPAPS